MFRAVLRPYLAVVLLLCLGRTLLPEAWVLAWHSHEHTIREPAYRVRPVASRQQLLITAQHKHCHAEQFYNIPFMAAGMVRAPRPRQRVRYLAFAVVRPGARLRRPLCGPGLRGPPARG